MPKTILLNGAFDVKGEDYNFVHKIIEKQGCRILTMNWGVFEDPKLFPIDVSSTEVAKAGGADLAQLQHDKDRGAAMKAMAAGVAVMTKKLFEEKKFDGVLGLGGSGGTSVITSGMRAIPIGVPKVMVSTVASGDTSFFVGLKDITMIPSIVDIAGVNLISEKILTQAAGAICGMVNLEYQSSGDQKPIITATMFGQTTPVVNRCREILLGKGYEVLIFHASGTGGRTMESMIEEGLVYAVLDIGTARVDDVVSGPGGHDDRETCPNGRSDAIEDGLAGAFFHAKELVQLVDFRPDLFAGLQSHDHELAVLCRVENLAKIVIPDRWTLDVLHKTFHVCSMLEHGSGDAGSC